MREMKCCFREEDNDELMTRYKNFLINIHKNVFGLNSFISVALLVENISFEITKLSFSAENINLDLLVKYCEENTEKALVDFFENLQNSSIENLMEILMREHFEDRERIILEKLEQISLQKKIIIFSYLCPYLLEFIPLTEEKIEILSKNQIFLNKLFSIYDKLSKANKDLLVQNTIKNLENLERDCKKDQASLNEFLLIFYDLSKKNFHNAFLQKIKAFKVQDSLNNLLKTQNISLPNFLKIITISKNLNFVLTRRFIDNFIKDNFNNFDDKTLSMIFKILAISKQLSIDTLNLLQMRLIKNLDIACTKTIGNLMQGITFVKAYSLSIHFLQPLTEIVLNRADRPEYSNIVSE